MPQLFNYGSCCIDHVYQVPHFVAPGETLSASAYEIFPAARASTNPLQLRRLVLASRTLEQSVKMASI